MSLGAEIAAIRAAFTNNGSSITVGSIKPNIGHLESASGIASLIKGILMLENDSIPPNVNLVTLKENLQGINVVVSSSHSLCLLLGLVLTLNRYQPDLSRGIMIICVVYQSTIMVMVARMVISF